MDRRTQHSSIRIVLFFLFTLATPLQSQENAGSLQGRVLDQQGDPLPSANVIVKSPALQGIRGMTTDTEGFFRLLALPPGVYSVEVRRVSSRPVVLNNVRIRLGMTTTTGDLRLEPQSVVMSDIVVSGDRPLIDPTSPDVGATLVTEEFQYLPLQRNFLSIPTLLPQANESPFGEGANFSGATGLENQYRIDGAEVTDPIFGIRGLSIPYNFIKDIEVRSGAYAAEYRGTLGGIVNATTYSGGNEFTGQAFGFFTSNGLGASPFGTADSRNTRGYANYDVGFGVGGPIVLDRLWFYGAYNPSTYTQEVEIPGIGWASEHQTSHGFAGKLTWKADDNLTIVGSMVGDPTTNRTVLGNPYLSTIKNVLNQGAVLQDVNKATINASISGTIVFQNNLMVEGSVSYLRSGGSELPAEESAKSELQFIDQQTGTISGGIGWWADGHITQTTAEAKATWIVGHHTVKGGCAYREKVNEAGYFQNTLVKYGDTEYVTEVWAWDGTTRNRIPSVFLQDMWEVSDRLTLNAGLRWDGQFIIGSDSHVHQKILGQYQPRIGFVLQLGEPGVERIYGSAGRFYEELGMNFVGYYSDRLRTTYVTYDHDPRVDPSGGTTNYSLSSIPLEVSGLKGQFTDEIVLGYERRVLGQFKAGIRGIYRTLGAAIEDAYVENLGEWRTGNPGEGDLSSVPKARRDYAALVFTFEKPIGDGYSFSLAYVLSRNYGNYPGLYNLDNEQLNPNATTIFDYPESYPNSTGLLPNDVTHMLKLSGSYAFPFGLTAGAAFFLQSGTPINEFGGTTAGPAWVTFLQPRGTAGRMPMLWDLNLRLTYDVAQLIGWSVHPRLIVDVLHVASQKKATVVDQVHYFSKDPNGSPTDPNPYYLNPTHYQQPMCMRVGMEVNF